MLTTGTAYKSNIHLPPLTAPKAYIIYLSAVSSKTWASELVTVLANSHDRTLLLKDSAIDVNPSVGYIKNNKKYIVFTVLKVVDLGKPKNFL